MILRQAIHFLKVCTQEVLFGGLMNEIDGLPFCINTDEGLAGLEAVS